jgi:hypothetical protein
MPNIKSLVRRQDVEALMKAASHKDLAPSSVGTVRDRGIPVRADAVLALAMLAPKAARAPTSAQPKTTRTSTWQGYGAAGVRRQAHAPGRSTEADAPRIVV